MGVAVSCLYVWPGAAVAPMLWWWWTAESFSCLDTRVTFRWTLRPRWPFWPAAIHWKFTIQISLFVFSILSKHIICGEWVGTEELRSLLYICHTWTLDSVARLLLLAVSITGRVCVCVVEGSECVVAAAESSSDSHIIHVVETRLTALWPASPFTPNSIWLHLKQEEGNVTVPFLCDECVSEQF